MEDCVAGREQAAHLDAAVAPDTATTATVNVLEQVARAWIVVEVEGEVCAVAISDDIVKRGAQKAQIMPIHVENLWWCDIPCKWQSGGEAKFNNKRLPGLP